MIKFFRKIRHQLLSEGKTGKYLKYAFGEIFLVVIGILIALSINNWNQARIEQLQEQKWYEKIIGDLNIALVNVKTETNRFNGYQVIHKHIYDETRGRASYDPEIKYQAIRWNPGYVPLISENHGNNVSDIMNERVRDALNDYMKEEKVAMKAFADFNRIKLEMVRPFVDKHGFMDSEIVFNEVQSNWKNVRDKEVNIINHDKLKAQYDSEEFSQILATLWIQSGFVIYRLEEQEKQINTLKRVLEEELQK
ncbi:MAG: hypothetical protein KJN75_05920 [Muriicola sp.]|nr:hypothetical protein [Muriicola sp.]